MAKIISLFQLFFFFVDYAFSVTGQREFRFAFKFSYAARNGENKVVRTFHALKFACDWVYTSAEWKFYAQRQQKLMQRQRLMA